MESNQVVGRRPHVGARTGLAIGGLCVLALVAIGIVGCAPSTPDSWPLFSEERRPEVLTEAREIAIPPATGGNRFVAGWWPWNAEDGFWMLPDADQGGRIEVVNLAERPRRLVVDSRSGSSFALDVTVDGGSPRRVALQGRGELPFDSLPLGRSLMTLYPRAEGGAAVGRVALVPAAPPGGATWQEDRLAQEANSLVEVVFPLKGSSRLGGRIRLPREGNGDTEATLFWERSPGVRQEVGRWRSADLGRSGKGIGVELEGDGFVRLSFLVRGRGEVLWDRLTLSPAAAPDDEGPMPALSYQESETEAPRLVLLYVMDALRSEVVGYHGSGRGASPTLDRLAREGLVFLSHRSVAPNTLPSTKSLFVGRIWRQGGGLRLAEGAPTLAETWRAGGYRTGLLSGNVYVTPTYGLDRGFDHVGEEALWNPRVDGDGREVNDNAAVVHPALLAWLDEPQATEKAFAYVHTVHPHNPYEPPAPFPARFTAGIPSTIEGSTRVLLDVRNRRLQPTEADQQRLSALYAANLAYNDALLADLLEQLAARYKPGEVLLVVTSDHGEELFDHDGVLHGYTLYEEQLAIPLLLWWPGRIEPGRIARATSTIDLHHTLRALAHGEVGHLLRLPRDPGGGVDPCGSVAPRPGDRPPAVHLAAASNLKGGIYSAATARWKYVWAPRTGNLWGMGEGRGRTRDPEYLFDLCGDSRESRNLAGLGDFEAQWLRAQLLAWAEEPEDEDGGEASITAEDEARLRALGYHH